MNVAFVTMTVYWLRVPVPDGHVKFCQFNCAVEPAGSCVAGARRRDSRGARRSADGDDRAEDGDGDLRALRDVPRGSKSYTRPDLVFARRGVARRALSDESGLDEDGARLVAGLPCEPEGVDIHRCRRSGWA